MATYYARNVTGNWASTSSWDSASSGGAGPAGPPVAGDTAIFDSAFTGNITIAANAACATLTAQAGATGTLTWGAFSLTMSASPTFVTGFNLAGTTGRLILNGAATITSGGLTIPGAMTINANATLVGNLTIAGQLAIGGTCTLSGAYNISCADFACNSTFTIVSGQAVTITNSCIISPQFNSQFTGAVTVKSVTASSVAYLAYTGTLANLRCFGATFTDIDFSTNSTPVTNLDNWYGSTLTRTVGITNRTSADIGGSSGAGAWAHRMIAGGF